MRCLPGDPVTLRLGFIGLGNMGAPMAANLARAGFPLTVYDLRPEPLAALAALGATIARSPREVGERSEIVSCVVVDDAQVERVFLGGDGDGGGRSGDAGADDGLLAGLAPGSIFIVHSTVSPLGVRRLAEAARPRGVHVVDAAVSGAEERSKAGTLSIMAGGDAEIVARCRPVFDVIGEHVYHVGGLGQGLAAKLCNNLILLGTMQTLEEALRIAKAAGVDERTMIEIARNSTGDSWAVRNYFVTREMMQHHPQGPKGARQIGVKDLSLAAKLGRGLGLDVPIADFFAERPWE
jgi:3-hydroxyisobutyrate dehydrogenase-like beta-hydroxyacid dehydrogenase